ncbi:MAG: hypothetical protein ACPGOY_07535 [Rhodospirillaceae bacterium]
MGECVRCGASTAPACSLCVHCSFADHLREERKQRDAEWQKREEDRREREQRYQTTPAKPFNIDEDWHPGIALTIIIIFFSIFILLLGPQFFDLSIKYLSIIYDFIEPAIKKGNILNYALVGIGAIISLLALSFLIKILVKILFFILNLLKYIFILCAIAGAIAGILYLIIKT